MPPLEAAEFLVARIAAARVQVSRVAPPPRLAPVDAAFQTALDMIKANENKSAGEKEEVQM